MRYDPRTEDALLALAVAQRTSGQGLAIRLGESRDRPGPIRPRAERDSAGQMGLELPGPGAGVGLGGRFVEDAVPLGVGRNDAIPGHPFGRRIDASAGLEDGEGLLSVGSTALGHGRFLQDSGALEETRTHQKDESAGSTDMCVRLCRSGTR